MKKEIDVFMRTIKLLIIIFVVLLVAGCSPQKDQIIVQNNDSLKVCVLDYDKVPFLDLPLEKFQAKYPDVEIELEILSAENLNESRKIASTEIMAENGADIYINPTEFLGDLYKIQEAGMLENLMPWLEKTEGFVQDNYLSGVFDLYEDTEACYIFPTGLVPGVFAIRRDMADTLNLKITEWDNASDLYDAMEKYYEKYPEGSPFLRSEPYTQWLSGHGFRISEGKENERVLDSQLLKRDMMLYKKQAYPEGKFIRNDAEKRFGAEVEQLYRGEGNYLGRYFTAYNVEEYLRMGGGDELILVPQYDDMGNIRMDFVGSVAVSANSSNKENAVRLIQIILEEENKPGGWGGGSADREKNKEYLRQLYDQWVKDEVVIDGKVRKGLTENDYQIIENIYQKGTVVSEPSVFGKFQEIMEAFFTNESSYEACIEEFRDYLEIYYSE